MMQVQNQTQQISEEEFLLPLSEDELEIVHGGAPIGAIRFFTPRESQPFKEASTRFSFMSNAANSALKDLGQTLSHIAKPQ